MFHDTYNHLGNVDKIIMFSGCRVHVERISAESHRLYITSVQISDAGLYSCESIINGALITVDTRLEIFGTFSKSLNSDPPPPQLLRN